MPDEFESPNVLSAKKSDLSEWYHQILLLADIVDIRYNSKGMNVWKGYGFRAMRLLKKFWDDELERMGVTEMYFPQIIPLEYCEMNPSWWEGFRQEGFRVIAGSDDEVQGALRPTGEAAMYPMYAKWIRTHADLPFRAYETVSSFRYETRHTRPLIRDREITLWHEIHTVHATKEDSLKEADDHVRFYQRLWEFVAMKPLVVNKPAWELFPGAVGGVEFYNITPDGKAMENGSVNILGQAYSKKFNISFKDKDGSEKLGWQVCTGNGARLFAGVVLEHGDDKGLVLPPSIAPVEVVIVPILSKAAKDAVLTRASELAESLRKEGVRVKVDDTDTSPGRRYYEWELKGVPLRLELGPREVEESSVIIASRLTGTKESVSVKELVKEVTQRLVISQHSLLSAAAERLSGRVVFEETLSGMESSLVKNKCVQSHWCGSEECYDRVKGVVEGAEIFGTDRFEKRKGQCVACGKACEDLAYVARTY